MAKFARHAPKYQIRAFWKEVGKQYAGLIGKENKWLSTAGLGVPWLHVRVDSAPKYYRHADFKKIYKQ
jgi:hypothetical protein